MLKLIENSCEIYCLTIYMYAHFMMGTQVINHKIHISEVSFPDQGPELQCLLRVKEYLSEVLIFQDAKNNVLN